MLIILDPRAPYIVTGPIHIRLNQIMKSSKSISRVAYGVVVYAYLHSWNWSSRRYPYQYFVL